MFDRVQVFSATKAAMRDSLGQKITDWVREYEGEIVDKVVRQSSDSAFHCLSVILFCRDRALSDPLPKRRRTNGL